MSWKMFQHLSKSKLLEQTKQDLKNQPLLKKKWKRLLLQKAKHRLKVENKKKQKLQLSLIQMNKNSSLNYSICKEVSYKPFQITYQWSLLETLLSKSVNLS